MCPADDLFAAGAEGRDVLRERGAVATPQVLLATRDVLVLSVLQTRPAQEAFWEQLAHALARLHTTTVHDRFGWERDNWHGRCRQENAWNTDGYEFFAQRQPALIDPAVSYMWAEVDLAHLWCSPHPPEA